MTPRRCRFVPLLRSRRATSTSTASSRCGTPSTTRRTGTSAPGESRTTRSRRCSAKPPTSATRPRRRRTATGSGSRRSTGASPRTGRTYRTPGANMEANIIPGAADSADRRRRTTRASRRRSCRRCRTSRGYPPGDARRRPRRQRPAAPVSSASTYGTQLVRLIRDALAHRRRQLVRRFGRRSDGVTSPPFIKHLPARARGSPVFETLVQPSSGRDEVGRAARVPRPLREGLSRRRRSGVTPVAPDADARAIQAGVLRAKRWAEGAGERGERVDRRRGRGQARRLPPLLDVRQVLQARGVQGASRAPARRAARPSTICSPGITRGAARRRRRPTGRGVSARAPSTRATRT